MVAADILKVVLVTWGDVLARCFWVQFGLFCELFSVQIEDAVLIGAILYE